MADDTGTATILTPLALLDTDPVSVVLTAARSVLWNRPVGFWDL